MIRMGSACVAEQFNTGVSIERIENLSIVSLKVSSKSIECATDRLQLASPINASSNDPRSLWFGPDRWLLVSSSMSAESMVQKCEETLADALHNVVDNSAGLAVFRVAGPGARDLLAADCGLDFRPQEFPVGTCCRTRLAQIAAIIAAEGPEQFDIYVDRSYEAYFGDWLRDSLSIAASLAAPTGAAVE
jgi:heterotetrameric sarcosine oxidase gamma subunit